MKIYKITNKIDGKSYIGKCVGSIEKRFQRHCRPSSGCIKIKNAINKYGKENFEVEELEVCENTEVLSKREVYWIKHYNSIEKGYNLTKGGDGGLPNEEVREKIRKYRTGKKASQKTKDKMSKNRTGHKNSKAKKTLVTMSDGTEKIFDCLRYASDALNISYSCARALAQGYSSKSRQGYKIKYLEE